MRFKETLRRLRENPKDAWYYIQGNYRLALYRRPHLSKWFLRSHIIEQFEWRRDGAAHPCYLAGQCYCCECETPGVFFSNKACSAGKIWHCQDEGKPECYPKMMSWKEWAQFKKSIPKI